MLFVMENIIKFVFLCMDAIFFPYFIFLFSAKKVIFSTLTLFRPGKTNYIFFAINIL